MLVATSLLSCAGSGPCPRSREPSSTLVAPGNVERSSDANSQPSDTFPVFFLGNPNMQVQVFPPDAVTGYYRGIRFDRSGIIGSVKVGAHRFVEPWQATHDPLAHDAATGPAEEFGIETPLGYAAAKPGESFFKIGVGELRRTSAEPYSFNGEYPLVRALPWRVEHDALSATFSQELPISRGFGYQYRKVVRLDPTRTLLVIEHTLKNTGSEPIHTNHYAHNFFRLDGQFIGPAYRVAFGAPVVVIEGLQPPSLGRLVGSALEVLGPIPAKSSIFGNLKPTDARPTFSFELENTQVGSKVRVSGDFAPEKFTVWSVREVVAPEVFIALHLDSGAEKSWATEYEFVVPPPDPDQ